MKITGNPPECGRGNLLAFQICKSTKIAGKLEREAEIWKYFFNVSGCQPPVSILFFLENGVSTLIRPLANFQSPEITF